jgi:transaldolase/glucose-6-phosphate isomerase
MTVRLTSMAQGIDISAIAARWSDEVRAARLWRKDPTVWFDPPRDEIGNRLGWLDLPRSSESIVPLVETLAADARSDGITDLVLCGMGGSSLAPEVFAATIPHGSGSPRLTVVDTTHPDAIAAVTERTSPVTTWYLVSSKSGGTLETLSLFRHFWAQASAALDQPGRHFVAVTDPGSSLERLAEERGFRAVVLADPNVGGRYSALSAFGLVPAGIVGADIRRLLNVAHDAADACGPSVALMDNPGFVLGATLGAQAAIGRDIVQFSSSEPVATLPIWIEQLIAESTGKEGRGIVPIAAGPAPKEGSDVMTISIGRSYDDAAALHLAADDPYDVAGVMFILEFATAVAGEIIGIHPFDQPDVQQAKALAHQAMEGSLETGSTVVRLIEDPMVIDDIRAAIAAHPRYVAIQAYVASTQETNETLEALRAVLMNDHGIPSTIGYGPRFLHSTGQLHKGGPPGGLFIQLVDSPGVVLPVPETDYTFNALIAAQAAGDRMALDEKARTVIAIDLGNESIAQAASTIVRAISA